MAQMPAGQTPACRVALRTYLRAARQHYDAIRAFLRSHQNTRLTVIVAGLNRQPYVTLRALAGKAERQALRLCD